MPLIIAIANQKGGAGKTTLAAHLGVAAQMRGHRTVLVDADPQGSLAEWAEAREAETPSVVTATMAELDGVKDLDATIVIIDSAPHAGAIGSAVVSVSDFVLVPVQPTPTDLRAVSKTVSILMASGKPAGFILNRVRPGKGQAKNPRVAEAREFLASFSVVVAPVEIPDLVAYADAMADGRAVNEYEPEGKASRQIDALLSWLLGQEKQKHAAKKKSR